MYALLGVKPAALQQMEIARRANDGDFYTMSEIDARIRELQSDIKREQDALRQTAGADRSAESTPPRRHTLMRRWRKSGAAGIRTIARRTSPPAHATAAGNGNSAR